MLTHDRLTSGPSATPPGHANPTAPPAGRQSWPAAVIVLLAVTAMTTTILLVRDDRIGAPTTAPTPPTTPTPTTPTPSTTAQPTACPLAQLEISVSDVGRGEGGMGHSSSALLFRNIGATACVLGGFPDVTGLDARGHAVTSARHTLRGYLGGLDPAVTAPPAVTLAPGRSAAALVEALNAAPDGTACTPFPTLRIALPGDPASRTVAWGDASGCAHLEVHPFVPSDDAGMDPVAPNRGG